MASGIRRGQTVRVNVPTIPPLDTRMICGGQYGNVLAGSDAFMSLFGMWQLGFDTVNPGNVIPYDCKISKLYVILDQPPGIGQSLTVTFRKNSSDTLLTVTISGNVATTGNDLINEIDLIAGDECVMKWTASGSCASVFVAWGAKIE